MTYTVKIDPSKIHGDYDYKITAKGTRLAGTLHFYDDGKADETGRLWFFWGPSSELLPLIESLLDKAIGSPEYQFHTATRSTATVRHFEFDPSTILTENEA